MKIARIIIICIIVLLIVESIYLVIQRWEHRSYSEKVYALLEYKAFYHLYNGLMMLNNSYIEEGVFELKQARLYMQLLARNSIAREKGVSTYIDHVASNISALIDYAEEHNLTGKIKYKRELYRQIYSQAFKFKVAISKNLEPEKLVASHFSWKRFSKDFKWYIWEIIGEID